eukprot:TRINITY_DN10629_c0_g1_i1.p1 TRINITY_DN10629_c0_g1~~TRINITY_DN10629_c0_g1_i1.p1  ORF type:complete len:164 (-),score=48.77 TRINITY_DN10629_c0_g1_i1:346-837(-)
MSKVLFGSEHSDRVLWLTSPPKEMNLSETEDHLKYSIFKQLSMWPQSIIALEVDDVPVSSLSFLTAAWNDHEPSIYVNTRHVKTNQAVFVVKMRLPFAEWREEKKERYDLQASVKEYLKAGADVKSPIRKRAQRPRSLVDFSTERNEPLGDRRPPQIFNIQAA